jgi:taurine dioxygenase
MAIVTRPLAPAIGAEILGLDLSRPLDSATAAEMRRIWLDAVIVLFRGQDLTQADLVRVTGCFGPQAELARPKPYRTKGHDDLLPGLMLISNIRENGEPIGNLPDGEMMFHHDMMHAEVPHKATLLYSVEVPSTGGNTLFANGYRAYETLPDEVREPLEGRKAFHHYNYGSVRKGDGKGIPAFSESTHPVFRTNPETGKKAVYVNRLMTESIVGLPRTESDRLLARLFDHGERREFVYEHEWRKGDLIVWDNRCSMHARTDFPSTERRLMWRATVQGDERPY